MMTADRDRPYIIHFSHQKTRAVAATDPILWRESISANFILSRTYTIGSVAGKGMNFVQQLFVWTSLYLLFKHEKQNNLKQLRHVMRYLEPLGLFFSFFFKTYKSDNKVSNIPQALTHQIKCAIFCTKWTKNIKVTSTTVQPKSVT